MTGTFWIIWMFFPFARSEIFPATPTACENEEVVVTCITEVPVDFLINKVRIEIAKPGYQQSIVSNGIQFTFRVNRSDNDAQLTCDNGTPNTSTATLVVKCK